MPSLAADLAELNELHNNGALTAAEFTAAKARLLQGSAGDAAAVVVEPMPVAYAVEEIVRHTSYGAVSEDSSAMFTSEAFDLVDRPWMWFIFSIAFAAPFPFFCIGIIFAFLGRTTHVSFRGASRRLMIRSHLGFCCCCCDRRKEELHYSDIQLGLVEAGGGNVKINGEYGCYLAVFYQPRTSSAQQDPNRRFIEKCAITGTKAYTEVLVQLDDVAARAGLPINGTAMLELEQSLERRGARPRIKVNFSREGDNIWTSSSGLGTVDKFLER